MKKNYLSKVPAAADQRAKKRYKCKAIVGIVYKKSLKTPIVACRAIIVDISQAGALVSGTFKEIPNHFYIVIGNFDYTIGCVVVRRDNNHLGVEFIKEQPLRLIEAFAMLSLPMAPLFSLKGLLKNEIIQTGQNLGIEKAA